MPKKPSQRPTPKDIPLMKYIWRWKIATTAALTARFYPDYHWSPKTTHWRLLRLKNRALVNLVQTNLSHEYAWSLTTKGFKIILPELPALKEQGFASENVTHDLLVQAVHLGEYLPRGSSPHVRTFTEQELRRIELSCYPEWVPQTQIHRPDGYWNLPDGGKRRVLALEVELSSKTTEDYNRIAGFYNQARAIDGVLWVVQSHAIAERIQREAKRAAFGFRDIHQFVSVGAFKEQGWQTPIFLGKYRGQKLGSFLDNVTSSQAPATLRSTSGRGWSGVILDTALRRIKPTTYQQIETLKKPLLYVSQLENAVSQTE